MREKDGGEEGIEEILPLVFSRSTRAPDCFESLCCRISFISYWCYFVLSGLTSACNRHLGDTSESASVCVWRDCVRVSAGVVSDDAFTPSLLSIPALICCPTCETFRGNSSRLVRVCRDIFVFLSVLFCDLS